MVDNNRWKNFGYPKSRQQHDATINRLEASNLVRPSIKVLLIRGVTIIVYLLLGALVFQQLEKGARDQLSDYGKESMAKEFGINIEQLKALEERLLLRLQNKHYRRDWGYYEALYFASTVTTTIGYGHITPQTQGGRVFLIIFALIGIPLNILALASMGEHIIVIIYYFLRFVNNKLNKTTRVRNINIKVVFVSLLLMFLMLFLGGVLYCSTEQWTYIDSIYYCFVAMSTIGFGDLVPNKGRAPDTKEEKLIWFLRAIYLSIGLSLVSTVFTALSNAMEEINSLLAKTKYAEIWKKYFITSLNTKDFNRRSLRRRRSFRRKKISRKNAFVGNIDWDGLLAEHKRKEYISRSEPGSQCERQTSDSQSSSRTSSVQQPQTHERENKLPAFFPARHNSLPLHSPLVRHHSSPANARAGRGAQRCGKYSQVCHQNTQYLEIPGGEYHNMWRHSPEHYDIILNQC